MQQFEKLITLCIEVLILSVWIDTSISYASTAEDEVSVSEASRFLFFPSPSEDLSYPFDLEAENKRIKDCIAIVKDEKILSQGFVNNVDIPDVTNDMVYEKWGKSAGRALYVAQFVDSPSIATLVSKFLHDAMNEQTVMIQKNNRRKYFNVIQYLNGAMHDAVDTLAVIGDPEPVDWIIEMVESDNGYLQEVAYYYCRKMADKSPEIRATLEKKVTDRTSRLHQDRGIKYVLQKLEEKEKAAAEPVSATK